MEGFVSFCKSSISEDDCTRVEILTKDQKDSPLWHHVRFGRVTASRLFDVAHCRTVGGSVVESILGASKFTGTAATKGGLALEGEVLAQVEGLLGVVQQGRTEGEQGLAYVWGKPRCHCAVTKW